MNCFEFRKRTIAEPRAADADVRRHREECAACAAFAERQDDFERHLKRAVEVDVPANLAARVLLAQTTRRAARFQVNRVWAYAAMLLLTLGVVGALLFGPPGQALDEQVIAHIKDEPEHLMSQDTVPTERAAQVLARVGVTLQGELGLVRFADRCPGRPGAHLVLAGSRGPLTVMVMPENAVASRQVLARDGFSGVIVPFQKGSMAIVGFPGEPIGEHEARIRAALGDDASRVATNTTVPQA